jgi:hypothetical protein
MYTALPTTDLTLTQTAGKKVAITPAMKVGFALGISMLLNLSTAAPSDSTSNVLLARQNNNNIKCRMDMVTDPKVCAEDCGCACPEDGSGFECEGGDRCPDIGICLTHCDC